MMNRDPGAGQDLRNEASYDGIVKHPVTAS
jgi:hypothetical protein